MRLSEGDAVWARLHRGLGVGRQDRRDEEVALGLYLLLPAGGLDRRPVRDPARCCGQRLEPVVIQGSDVEGVPLPLVSVIGGLTVR